MHILLIIPIALLGIAVPSMLLDAIKAPGSSTIGPLAVVVLTMYLLVRLFLALRKRASARRAKRAAGDQMQTQRACDDLAELLPERPAQPAPRELTTIYRDKVKGTSYRQANLRKAAGWIDRGELLDWSLARDSYQGKPSIRVMVSRIDNPSPELHLGYIAREDVEILLPCVDTCVADGEVYGGPTDDDPDRFYGAYIRVYQR